MSAVPCTLTLQDTDVEGDRPIPLAAFPYPYTMIATFPASSSRPIAPVTATVDQRPRLQAELALFEQQATSAVQEGDLDQAAKAILNALDCERRLACFGPQVLQLIKPRN